MDGGEWKNAVKIMIWYLILLDMHIILGILVIIWESKHLKTILGSLMAIIWLKANKEPKLIGFGNLRRQVLDFIV